MGKGMLILAVVLALAGLVQTWSAHKWRQVARDAVLLTQECLETSERGKRAANARADIERARGSAKRVIINGKELLLFTESDGIGGYGWNIKTPGVYELAEPSYLRDDSGAIVSSVPTVRPID